MMRMTSQHRPYHHRDLRQTLIEAAVEMIGVVGPSAMSMRSVARRAGVTHAAATYHFGDKAGLLTAVAAKGNRLLGAELDAALHTHTSFLEVGVAYVRFAVTERLPLRDHVPTRALPTRREEVRQARARAARILYGTDHADTKQLTTGVAAWAIVHGLATLWLGGNLPSQLGDDPEQITRLVAAHLRPSDH